MCCEYPHLSRFRKCIFLIKHYTEILAHVGTAVFTEICWIRILDWNPKPWLKSQNVQKSAACDLVQFFWNPRRKTQIKAIGISADYSMMHAIIQDSTFDTCVPFSSRWSHSNPSVVDFFAVEPESIPQFSCVKFRQHCTAATRLEIQSSVKKIRAHLEFLVEREDSGSLAARAFGSGR